MGMAGKGKKANTEKHSLATQVGVILSPARIKKILVEGKVSERYSKKAMCYLAGALDYLVGEVMEVASLKAHENKRNTISNPDIYRGIRSDKELFNVVLQGKSFVKGAGFVGDAPQLPAAKPKTDAKNAAM